MGPTSSHVQNPRTSHPATVLVLLPSLPPAGLCCRLQVFPAFHEMGSVLPSLAPNSWVLVILLPPEQLEL